MGGFRVAITPRMVSEWATTPCWDMRAETSLANSSMADGTHCCLVTCITDTERKIRVQNRDLAVGCSTHRALCDEWDSHQCPLSLLDHDPDPQFPQLSLSHGRRRFHHKVLRGSGFGEGNYLAQTIRSRQNHHNAIEAERDPAVRRGSVLERFQEEAEARARFFFRHAERAENSALHILPVNTYRARSQLCPIQHHVVEIGR